MIALTASYSKEDIDKSFDYVVDGQDIAVVARGEGRDVVIMSLDEYNSYKETIHLMSTEANHRELRASMEDLDAGRFTSFANVDDLRKFLENGTETSESGNS